MLKRFFVAFTAVFAGALGVEVLNYHAAATIARDRWAVAPQLSETLLLFAALALLARPTRQMMRFFAAMAIVSIGIGLIGLGFHFRSHGLPADFATSTSWLGDPPPLAPVEFSVVGLLGLFAVSWARGGSLVPSRRSMSSTILYGIGALFALAAFVLAGAGLATPSFLSVFVALGFGAVGYGVELYLAVTDTTSPSVTGGALFPHDERM